MFWIGLVSFLGSLSILCSTDCYKVSPDQSAYFDVFRLDAHYIEEFPFAEYRVYTLPEQASFYVDNLNDYIKSHIADGTPWEAHIGQQIQKYARPQSIMIDIGAHIGTHTILMSRIAGENGLVLAFEPQKKICRELVMNLRLNNCSNVIPLNCALGDQQQFSFLGRKFERNEGARYITETPSDETVHIETLDSFELSNVSLIKIDTENFELKILQGARQTILRNHPIILIEIMANLIKANEEALDVAALKQVTIDFLHNLDYHVSHIGGDDYIAIPRKQKESSDG